MRTMKWIAAAVLASAFAATAASADTVAANGGGCNQMATSVKAAMDSNASSPNLADAQKEAHLGRELCTNQLYARGITAYQHALDLLGGKS